MGQFWIGFQLRNKLIKRQFNLCVEWHIINIGYFPHTLRIKWCKIYKFWFRNLISSISCLSCLNQVSQFHSGWIHRIKEELIVHFINDNFSENFCEFESGEFTDFTTQESNCWLNERILLEICHFWRNLRIWLDFDFLFFDDCYFILDQIIFECYNEFSDFAFKSESIIGITDIRVGHGRILTEFLDLSFQDCW